GLDLIFARSLLHIVDRAGIQRHEVSELAGVFLQRMSGDEESEYFFFSSEALEFIPFGNVRQSFRSRGSRIIITEDAEESVLAGLGITLRLLRTFDGLVY